MRHIDSFKIFESKGNPDTTPEVMAAARAKGYNIGPVYHGTNAEFTEFDPEKVIYFKDEPMKFSFAYKKEFAAERGQLGEKMSRVLCVFIKGDVDGTYDDDDNLVPANADHVNMEDFMITVRNPEQIKLADPVTYDDNGKPISLSKRFDSTKKDIRY
mgnify:CR=1 FL=1